MKKTPSNKDAVADKRRYSAPALEKGLDILELLSGEDQGLTISGIAKRLDRSVSELFRMLVVLADRGYIVSPPDSDRYVLTLKMFELAHRFRPMHRLTSMANPLMQELTRQIEQSCHLTIYYEGKGHVVAQQDAPSARVFSVKLGAEAPLLDSCSGHILLAYADEDERAFMVSKIPGRHRRKATSNELETISKRVRRQGFELVKSSIIHGITDIGYPVFDHTGKNTAALVVPFFSYLDGSHPVTLSDAQPMVGDTAARISAALGASAVS